MTTYNLQTMKNSKLLLSIILLCSIAIATVSCGSSGPVYEKYVKMKNYTWDRFDIKNFDIPIEKENRSYDFTIVVRNTESFIYDKLQVYVILTTPSGEERMREVSIPVRENGKMLGQQTGNVFEVRSVLWKNINIAEIGECKITIENMIPKIQTEGIDEIGIVVKKAEG